MLEAGTIGKTFLDLAGRYRKRVASSGRELCSANPSSQEFSHRPMAAGRNAVRPFLSGQKQKHPVQRKRSSFGAPGIFQLTSLSHCRSSTRDNFYSHFLLNVQFAHLRGLDFYSLLCF